MLRLVFKTLAKLTLRFNLLNTKIYFLIGILVIQKQSSYTENEELFMEHLRHMVRFLDKE